MGMENVWGLAGQRMMMSPANHARSASIAQVMMSPAFEAAEAGAVPGGYSLDLKSDRCLSFQWREDIAEVFPEFFRRMKEATKIETDIV